MQNSMRNAQSGPGRSVESKACRAKRKDAAAKVVHRSQFVRKLIFVAKIALAGRI